MKYEVNALLYGEPTKFIVKVPDEVNGYMINKYQVSLLLMGKYGNDIVIESDSITEVVELDFTKENWHGLSLVYIWNGVALRRKHQDNWMWRCNWIDVEVDWRKLSMEVCRKDARLAEMLIYRTTCF